MHALNSPRSNRLYDTLKGRLMAWVEKRMGASAGTIASFVLLLPDIVVLIGRVMLDRRAPRSLTSPLSSYALQSPELARPNLNASFPGGAKPSAGVQQISTRLG